MRKLLTIILFCMTNTVILQAQENKPTKEETIKFIKSYFEEKEFEATCENENGSIIYSRKYSKFKIDFLSESSTMIVSWNLDFQGLLISGEIWPNTSDRESIEIDLSKIESVQVKLHRASGGCDGGLHYGIWFNAVPGYRFRMRSGEEITSEKNAFIPSDLYEGEDMNMDNYKIAQAFNHLRKLCGAPEPISFD